MGRRIAYCRVSTQDQDAALQRDALEAAGYDLIFEDHGVSGSKSSRPALDTLLVEIREGDQLIVWKLDRLSRSLRHFVNLVHDLKQRGVGFESLTEKIDTSNPYGELFFYFIALLANFERQLISERTKAGMEAARKRGKRLGRPTALTRQQANEVRSLLKQRKSRVRGLAVKFGVSTATIYRAE